MMVGALLSPTSFAAESEQELTQINVPMTEMGHWFEKTMPYVFDDTMFSDPNKQEQLRYGLKQMRHAFQTASVHLEPKSVTNKISARVLQQQLSRAQDAFDRDELWLAQSILKGVPSVCMSCHRQDEQGQTLFKSNQNHSLVFQAEMSFVSRDYENAIQHYQALLETQPKPSAQLKALERLLSLSTEVDETPKAMTQRLESYRALPLDKSVQATLNQWIIGLDETIGQGIQELTLDFAELDEYMKSHFVRQDNEWLPKLTQEKDMVFYILLRKQLHHAISSSNDKDMIPVALYWLAVCDRALEHHSYYSLADWYLKECIHQYPDHPFANHCYDTYKDYVTFSYTGSRGTEIPAQVEQELESLRDELMYISE